MSQLPPPRFLAPELEARLEARLGAAVNAAAAHAGAAEVDALVARLEPLLTESLNAAVEADALDPAAFIADRVGRSAGEDAGLREFARALRAESEGCGASDPSPGGSNPPDGAAATTLWLLERLLQRRAALPPLPVLPHDRRRPSGERGLSLAALEGIGRFYARHGGLAKVMGDVCKEEGFAASVVALTRGSGLSLAETLELEGEAAGVDTSGIVGPASDFFSYSWTGTKLADMLGAIADAAPALARGGETRLWVDMFAASQNLLAGAFRDEAHPKGSAGYAARKEDTDRIFDDALLSVRSILLYCSPLVGEWEAPPHGFLSPERERRGVEHPWRRHGPGAISRERALCGTPRPLPPAPPFFVPPAPGGWPTPPHMLAQARGASLR